MSFLKSKHSGWLSDGTRTPFSGGGSGGGGPTNTTVQNTNIPEYARPYVESMLGTAQQQIYTRAPGTAAKAATYDPYGNELTPYQPATEGEITGFRPYVPYGATVDPKTGAITNTAQEQAGAAVAGFSPLQQQAIRNAGTVGMPGQFNLGTGFQAMGGAGALQAAQGAQPLMGEALGYGATGAQYGGIGAQQALQRAQQTGRQAGMYGGMGAQYGGMGAQAAQQGFGAGEAFARQATDPSAMQAYMSPYMQNAVDYQKSQAIRDFDIGLQGQKAQAVGKGAFGGSRQAILEAEGRRNLGSQLQGIQATGTQKAFEDAQRQQQFGANLGLQGLQAGYGGLGLGIQGAQAGLQGVGAQQAAGQLGLQGTAQGMQGAGYGLQGVQGAVGAGQYGLQGFGAATQAGSALGQMGGQQLAAQQGIINLQSQAGAQQQQLEQQKINQAIQNYAMQQQYPMQQLAAMSGLLRGLPLQSATTQSYQAAPSAVSQISGLGLTGAAAYGLMKKEGGIIKSYAKGGEVEDDTEDFADGGITRDVMLNPEKYSAQMIDRSTKNGVIDDIVGLAALQQKNQEAKERQALMAMAQGTPPTIKDQIIAEAQQLQGIDTAQSNLPTEYAGGGIVAFSSGGTPKRDDEGNRMPYDPSMGFPEMIGDLPSYIGSKAGPFFRGLREQINTGKAAPGATFSPSAQDPGAAPTPAEAAPADKPALAKPRFLDDTSKDKSPAAAPAAAAAAPASSDLDTSGSGIDDLIRQISGDMRTSKEASKDARKEAKLMAMLQAGLGIMGGTSQYAAANFKGAIPALQGYQEEMRGIRGDEAKQIAQLAALNLKGAELKQELKKLGITKERYDSQNREDAAKIGLYGAQEDYFKRRPGTSGSAGLGGAIPPNVFDTVSQRYEGYRANPMASPVFASLPAKVQEGFKQKYKPGTQSYANLMAEYDKAAAAHMNNYLNSMSILNRKSAVE